MARILVTGAAGFIGSHLVQALLARGDEVIGIDNFNEYYDPDIKRKNTGPFLKNPRYRLFEDDITNEERMGFIFRDRKPEVVVHLAARAGVRPSLENPNLYHRVNVIGTQNILDACVSYPPSHLVLASSSSVYGGLSDVPFSEDMNISKTISPYAATKRMNELMCYVYHHVYGLRITMLRFFTVYGPRQRPDMAIHKFTKLMSEGKHIPMFGDGSTQRDYTYIDDIIEGLVQSVDRAFDYEIFNLGESRTTSLYELINVIAQHLGVKPKINRLAPQPGDVPITYANIEKARALLGYNPTTTIDQGIANFVAWYRDQ